MAVDEVMLRAARNAYLLILIALVAVSTYQFVTIGGLAPEIAAIWVVGVGTYYGSKWYYGSRESGADDAATDGGESD